jgi:hypothetical protein
MLMLVDMGNPLGTRNLHGYGFGNNFIPVMGMGFLAGVFFLRGYGFGQVIPSGFLPLSSLLAANPRVKMAVVSLLAESAADSTHLLSPQPTPPSLLLSLASPTRSSSLGSGGQHKVMDS